jgi:hypothetical protein
MLTQRFSPFLRWTRTSLAALAVSKRVKIHSVRKVSRSSGWMQSIQPVPSVSAGSRPVISWKRLFV